MEPRREEPKVPNPGTQQKPKRFRLIKLEERIAPGKGGQSGNTNCACSRVCTGTTYSIE